jgi:hypothetical protein
MLALIISTSCEDDALGIDDHGSVWLELSAEVQDGIAPDTVTYIGTLHGYIDTLTMCYPDDYSMCIDWPAKGCIWFSVCDSMQDAKRTYSFSYVYESPGQHRAIMWLHCRNIEIDPDTVFLELD